MMTLFEFLVTFLSSLYGVQIVVLLTLAAMTNYRREMSCNHCYHPVAASASSSSASADDAAPHGKEQQQQRPESSKTATSSSSSSTTTTRADSPLLLRTLTLTSCAAVSHEEYNYNGEESCSSCCSSSAGGCEQQRHDDAAAAGAAGASVHHALVGGCLPPDALVHILSYLSPRDVISFEFTCRAARILVHGENKKEENNNNNNNDDDDSSASATAKMTTSEMLWKTLWRRDYAWIVENWKIGLEAMQRSTTTTALQNDSSSSSLLISEEHSHLAKKNQNHHRNVTLLLLFDKDFYFRFAASWLNFVLAGRNCAQNGCYVGLNGHVYDMTAFVLIHPGSPETVLVQAGRDATAFFQNVRHSAGALRLAQSMCVVVDQSRIIVMPPPPIIIDDSSKGDNKENNKDTLSTKAASEKRSSLSLSTTKNPSSSSCGLRPTRHIRGLGSTVLRNQQEQQEIPKEQLMIPELSLSNMGGANSSNNNNINMLQRIQTQYAREEAQALQCAKQKYATTMRLTDVNVFYNPFLQTWQAWYTNPNMETVFCNVE